MTKKHNHDNGPENCKCCKQCKKFNEATDTIIVTCRRCNNSFITSIAKHGHPKHYNKSGCPQCDDGQIYSMLILDMAEDGSRITCLEAGKRKLVDEMILKTSDLL